MSESIKKRFNEAKIGANLYRSIQRTSIDGAFLVDAKGQLLTANDAFHRLLGYGRSELPGRRIYDIEAATTPFETARRKRAIEENACARYETLYARKDGRQIDVEVTEYPIAVGSGLKLAIVRDITERKRTEELIKESEGRFRSLAESATDAVIGCGSEGRTVSYWNKAAESIFGYKAEEIVGKPLNFVIPERLRKAHSGKIKHLISTKEYERVKRVFETVGMRKDGSEFPIELSYGYWTSKGEVYFVAIVRDITDRKKAEQALKRATAYLESILNSSLDLIFTIKKDATFGYFNPQLDRVTGYTPDSLKGKPFVEFIPDYLKDFMLDQWREINETGIPQTYETEIIKADGSIAHVLVSASVLKGYDEFLVMLRDITERKMTEQSLAKGKAFGDILNSVNATLSATFAVRETIPAVIERTAKAIRASSAIMLLRRGERWKVEHFIGLPRELADKSFSDDDPKLFIKATGVDEPLAIYDACKDPRASREACEIYGIGSLLAIPLKVREETTGILFFLRSTVEYFDEVELDFAVKLCASISLALENARLYEAQRSIADTLQSALLTIPERIPGIEFAHLYRSATEIAQVGGDFYDLFELEHGRVGLLIGDVSGKGIEAATMTSLIKDAIKAYAHVDPSPASIMAKTNHLAIEASTPMAFATAFFGILNTRTGALAYCNAGHPLPIIKRATSGVFQLSSMSTVIGAFADVDFEEETAELFDGDVLFLYTDGLTEARRGIHLFGDERLIDLLSICPPSPKKIPSCIFDEVLKFSGGILQDDVALLALTVSQVETK